MRNLEFQNGEYYHVYNRGVDGRTIFLDKFDFKRFLLSLDEFNQIKPIGSIFSHSGSSALNAVEPLVEMHCFCLNPNHFHLILKQIADKGISEYMKRLAGGYTWYFNNKHNRWGSLFQGRFKAIHIDSEFYLLWLSAYINGNSEIHKVSMAKKWPWSSFHDFISGPTALRADGPQVKKNFIFEMFKQFGKNDEYVNFVYDVILESSALKTEKKKYLLE